MFERTFSQPGAEFHLNMGGGSSDTWKIDEFVRENNADVEVLRGRASLTDDQIQSLSSAGKFIVAIGDQLKEILVREILSAADVAAINEEYSSGVLIQVAYMAISEDKRKGLFNVLDSISIVHCVPALRLELTTCRPVSDDTNTTNAEAYRSKILLLAEGNPGAIRVLCELLAEGSHVFDRVAPNLGTGSEIWEKYKDNCGEEISNLIARYS